MSSNVQKCPFVYCMQMWGTEDKKQAVPAENLQCFLYINAYQGCHRLTSGSHALLAPVRPARALCSALCLLSGTPQACLS